MLMWGRGLGGGGRLTHVFAPDEPQQPGDDNGKEQRQSSNDAAIATGQELFYMADKRYFEGIFSFHPKTAYRIGSSFSASPLAVKLLSSSDATRPAVIVCPFCGSRYAKAIISPGFISPAFLDSRIITSPFPKVGFMLLLLAVRST